MPPVRATATAWLVGVGRVKIRTAPRATGWTSLALRTLCRLWTVWAILLAVAPAAYAADKARMAVTLAQQASKSFETGDFARASEFYLAAWRTDPKPDFLFGAARSAQLGALNDKAVELFQQFLATEGADPERQKRAKEYLGELERAKVQSRVAEAERVQRDDPKVAAGLYLDAFKLAPSHFDLLFKAAVAEQSGRDNAAAERLLREYLDKAPTDAPDRNQAQARLDSMTRKAKEDAEPKVEPKPEPKPEPKVVQPEPVKLGNGALPIKNDAPIGGNLVKPAETSKPRWVGWALVGGGTALAIAGLAVYAATTPDISTFNQAKSELDATGKITKLSYQEMQDLKSSIYTRAGVGWALTGVGVAAAGVGTWWLLTAPPKTVSVVPGPGLTGVGVAVRF